MLRRFSINFAIFSTFFDWVILFVSLFSAVRIRPLFNTLSFIQNDIYSQNFPIFLYFIFPAIWVGILWLFSIYDGRKNLLVIDELTSITMGTFLSTISMAGILYFSFRNTSRFMFLCFILLGFILLVLWRMFYRIAFRLELLKGTNQHKVLIVGAGELGRNFGKQIQAYPQSLKLIGYMDDIRQDSDPDEMILGPFDAVRTIVENCKIDDVIMALPGNMEKETLKIVSELHTLAVNVWMIPDYLRLTLHKAAVLDFAGIPMLDLRAPTLSEYQRVFKRLFDIIVGTLSMFFALPIMGLIALLIKLDSPGNIFYLQKRVGENGKLFDMIKFRTMVKGADRMAVEIKKDENGNQIHKSPDDPRVTHLGRFLRHSSLDEIPQIFNVLKGEMSLVGPRPEIPSLVNKYELWQRKRFTVPQGMTGWWQINGRSDKPMYLHTDEDLYYVQHYSIWLDLQILIKTLWVVIKGRGAY